MKRITVKIPDDVEEWLEDEADRLKWSKADAGGQCIELLHSEVGHINPQQSTDLHSTAENSDSLQARVADLEARVDELEREGQPEPEPRAAAEAEPAGDEEAGAETEDFPDPDPEIVARVEALDWAEFDTNQTTEKAETVAICYERLRASEEGRLRTAAIRDPVYAQRSHGIGEGAWWSNWVSRALRQLPGVTSPPSGGQYWQFQPPE